MPVEEINYLCAGINHMAFYLKFERNGEDLYPLIRQVTGRGPRAAMDNRVRYEMLRRLGYFVTECSEHFSEYMPWFIKRDRPDLIEQLQHPAGRVHHAAASGRWPAGSSCAPRWSASDAALEVQRSPEYGSLIIHRWRPASRAWSTAIVPNHRPDRQPAAGLLRRGAVLVDKSGLQPTRIGALPPQLAALMQTNVNVQSLTVEAALTAQARAHLPRRHARPAHRRRAGPGSDLARWWMT